jgi:dolichyl-phosphate-mannose--protein O-mannosyl transferase
VLKNLAGFLFAMAFFAYGFWNGLMMYGDPDGWAKSRWTIKGNWGDVRNEKDRGSIRWFGLFSMGWIGMMTIFTVFAVLDYWLRS